MKGYAGTTPTVDAIGRLSLSGNVIPRAWMQWLKFDSGKPNSVAIMILSELCYWYRPVEEVDEKTGRVIGWRRKFKADKLQKSYQDLSDSLGFTKRQISDNVKWLEAKGLITIEFRHSKHASNLLFIDLCVDAIERISFSIPEPDHLTVERNPSNVRPEDGLTLERETYTEITDKKLHTEITDRTKKVADREPRTPDQCEGSFLNPNQPSQQLKDTQLEDKPNNSFCRQEAKRIGEDNSSAAANFSEKRKIGNRIWEFDEAGRIVLPGSSSEEILARKLAYKTLQIWLYSVLEEEGFELVLAPDSRVWVYDPRDEVWFEERELMPIKLLMALCVSKYRLIDVEEYNDHAIWYFDLIYQGLKKCSLTSEQLSSLPWWTILGKNLDIEIDEVDEIPA